MLHVFNSTEWVPFISSFLVSLATITALTLGLRWWLIRNIKKEYTAKAPKVPTNICDKGHVYPEEAALKLTGIPGLEGDVAMCPVCYDTNLHNAEKKALQDIKEWKNGTS